MERKISRRNYRGKATYEYERLFVPIPNRSSKAVEPWYGKDLRVSVESFEGGFAMLALQEDGSATEEILSEFRALVKGLEKQESVAEAGENVSDG